MWEKDRLEGRLYSDDDDSDQDKENNEQKNIENTDNAGITENDWWQSLLTKYGPSLVKYNNYIFAQR